MALDTSSQLQREVFTSGRGYSYYASTPGLPLSLKFMSNGQARYRFDRREVVVDDSGYLVLNEGQPYSIEIDSPTLVETFVLWFPREWVRDVAQCVADGAADLLEKPVDGGPTPTFFERYTPHDPSVSPRVRTIRAAFKSRKLIEDNWLEEKMCDLLAAMFATQQRTRREIANLPALRAATREELWRRVSRGRDYLHANLENLDCFRQSSTGGSRRGMLREAARAACLSPFHFLRVFQAAFGETPHQYLTHCRIERAKFLLEKTTMSVTDICLECGFTSLGSFSSLFQKRCGMSPRLWRTSRGIVRRENSNIGEEYLTGAR